MLVGADGRVRVTDFGLARALDSNEKLDRDLPSPVLSPPESPSLPLPPELPAPGAHDAYDSPLEVSLTRSGVLVGTPAYMPPEQLDQKSDARSDQFSFCASLYQALYGELPFAGARLAQYVTAVVRQEVRPAPAGTRVPSRLRAILLRGLQAKPEARFASMRELLDALDGVTQPRRARPMIWALLSAAVAAVVALTALGVRRAPQWRPEIHELGAAYDENCDDIDFSPDGKSIVYACDRGGSWRIYVAGSDGSNEHAVSAPNPSYLVTPRFTRDGHNILYAVLSRPPVVEKLNLADGKVEHVADGARQVDDCGGALLLHEESAPDCAGCQRLVLRDGAGSRELYRTQAGGEMRWTRCDSSGGRVTFGLFGVPRSLHLHARLMLMNRDGSGLRDLVGEDVINGYPILHPDGRSLLFSSARDGAFNVWERALTGGAPERITTNGFAYAPIVSPDGRTLLFNSDQTPWPLYAFSDGKKHRITHKLEEWFRMPVATRDGRELVAVSPESHTLELFAISIADGETRPLGEGNTPALSPDDATVYFSVGNRVLAQPRAGGERRAMATLPAPVIAMAMGGDGALHLTIDGGTGGEAWRLPLGGTATREAPAPYTMLLPAPAGGWSIAAIKRGTEESFELIPPGGTLGAAGNRKVAQRFSVWDRDGKSCLAAAAGAMSRVQLDGRTERLCEVDPIHSAVAVSPDGKTVYAGIPTGRVRRQIVINYGDRPRPR